MERVRDRGLFERVVPIVGDGLVRGVQFFATSSFRKVKALLINEKAPVGAALR